MATRTATYFNQAGEPMAEWQSCDQHGGEPVTDLPDADAARRFNRTFFLNQPHTGAMTLEEAQEVFRHLHGKCAVVTNDTQSICMLLRYHDEPHKFVKFNLAGCHWEPIP